MHAADATATDPPTRGPTEGPPPGLGAGPEPREQPPCAWRDTPLVPLAAELCGHVEMARDGLLCLDELLAAAEPGTRVRVQELRVLLWPIVDQVKQAAPLASLVERRAPALRVA